MMRSACPARTWRELAEPVVAMEGGVLCRPTIPASGQQPGRERPRRPRAKASRRCSGSLTPRLLRPEIGGGFPRHMHHALHATCKVP